MYLLTDEVMEVLVRHLKPKYLYALATSTHLRRWLDRVVIDAKVDVSLVLGSRLITTFTNLYGPPTPGVEVRQIHLGVLSGRIDGSLDSARELRMVRYPYAGSIISAPKVEKLTALGSGVIGDLDRFPECRSLLALKTKGPLPPKLRHLSTSRLPSTEELAPAAGTIEILEAGGRVPIDLSVFPRLKAFISKKTSLAVTGEANLETLVLTRYPFVWHLPLRGLRYLTLRNYPEATPIPPSAILEELTVDGCPLVTANLSSFPNLKKIDVSTSPKVEGPFPAGVVGLKLVEWKKRVVLADEGANLRKLVLRGTPAGSYFSGKALPRLESFELEPRFVDSPFNLSGMASLRTMVLRKSREVYGLESLTKLKRVYLTESCVEKLSPEVRLKHLTYAPAGSKVAFEIPSKSRDSLRSLDVKGESLDWSRVRLEILTHLSLRSIDLTTIELSKARRLSSLWLHHTQGTADVSRCLRLRDLRVNHHTGDVIGCAGLTRLRTVFLAHGTPEETVFVDGIPEGVLFRQGT